MSGLEKVMAAYHFPKAELYLRDRGNFLGQLFGTHRCAFICQSDPYVADQPEHEFSSIIGLTIHQPRALRRSLEQVLP